MSDNPLSKALKTISNLPPSTEPKYRRWIYEMQGSQKDISFVNTFKCNTPMTREEALKDISQILTPVQVILQMLPAINQDATN